MKLDKVITRIKPNTKEKKWMNDFIDKLIETSKSLSKEAKPMICGSVEKDTWLSKKYELDLFLLFSPDVPKKYLETKGLYLAKEIVKKLRGKYQIAFAEHPYLRGNIGRFQIDIVPCYDIENPEKIKSAVDRTPHHVKYVKGRLTNTDDVRLLKQFCISNGCYGADVKTLGFSGYLCELLIIKYGSFMDCIREASNWRAGHAISFENSTVEEVSKKFDSALRVVDPVDRNRNVGAAVSIENFCIFVKSCKEFLAKPKEDMFFKKAPKPLSSDDIGKKIGDRKTVWLVVSFQKPKVVDDVLYPQMKRCCKTFDNLFEKEGFKVLRSDFYCEKNCMIFFEMETWSIPKISMHHGPNVYSKHADQFLKHYKNEKVFIKDNMWTVEAENQFTDAYDFLKHILKGSKNNLLERGIPSKIAPLISKGKTYYKESSIRFMKGLSKDSRIFMREYFEKDFNVI
jgi:tRNA nucleotidyltransferase (CCA-adding enzyme)